VSLDADAPNLDSNVEEEFLADRFAAALLMPKIAIDAAFSRRGISLVRASGPDFFRVAQDLGVGYTTLLRHLQISHHVLSRAAADRLCNLKLANLRRYFVGTDSPRDVFVLDEAWGTRAVDLETGDTLVAPRGTVVVGECLVDNPRLGTFSASGVGEACATLAGGRSVKLRVSRRGFVGLAKYRYLEEDFDD
jgi:hypothetical protein